MNCRSCSVARVMTPAVDGAAVIVCCVSVTICRDSPFLSNHWYDAGLRDAVARDSFSVIARHFKSIATARPYRKRPVTE